MAIGFNNVFPNYRLMRNFAIICAYNEEKDVVSVVERTKKYVDEVIVVDDGSTDRTAELLKKNFGKDKKVITVTHGKNMGKGQALINGFGRFLKEGGDNVVTIDADGQSDPIEIPKLLMITENGVADIVIGSRFTRERAKIPIIRVVLNIFVNFMMVLISGSFYSDLSSGFRCYSKESIRKMLPELKIEGYGIEAETLRLASLKGLSVANVPITVSYDTGKKTNLAKMGKSYAEFVWKYKLDIVKRVFNRKV
jgi:glycosyltransferase involved in cell wall biosynthesis